MEAHMLLVCALLAAACVLAHGAPVLPVLKPAYGFEPASIYSPVQFDRPFKARLQSAVRSVLSQTATSQPVACAGSVSCAVAAMPQPLVDQPAPVLPLAACNQTQLPHATATEAAQDAAAEAARRALGLPPIDEGAAWSHCTNPAPVACTPQAQVSTVSNPCASAQPKPARKAPACVSSKAGNACVFRAAAAAAAKAAAKSEVIEGRSPALIIQHAAAAAAAAATAAVRAKMGLSALPVPIACSGPCAAVQPQAVQPCYGRLGAVGPMVVCTTLAPTPPQPIMERDTECWKLFPSMNCAGNSLRVHNNTGTGATKDEGKLVAICKAECTTEVFCVGFVAHTDLSKCELKTECSPAATKAGRTTYMQSSCKQPVPVACNAAQMQVPCFSAPEPTWPPTLGPTTETGVVPGPFFCRDWCEKKEHKGRHGHKHIEAEPQCDCSKYNELPLGVRR